MRKTFILFILFIALGSAAFGQVASAQAMASVDKLKRNEMHPLAVVLEINPPFHINTDKPTDEFMIPTVVTIKGPEGITLGKIIYPEGKTKEFAFSEQPLAVYEKTVVFFLTITVGPDFHGKEVSLEGTVGYQACDENNCQPPDETAFRISLPVAEADEKVTPIHQDIFSKMPPPKEEKSEDKERK